MSIEARQLKEFASASLGLLWQRQATFAGATVLVAFYVSLDIALICYSLCQLSEYFDYRVARRVLRWDGEGEEEAHHLLNLITLSSVLSSIAVVQYIILVALAEGPSTHIGPLFFLFAAALYSAMNNCQVPRVLVTRMSIYTAVFLFIPLYDLWLVRPPLESPLWKQLGIVLFVWYFVIECSRKFLRQYQSSLNSLEDLRIERDRVVKAYEMQSAFVSTVSHELRTPLTSVKGSLDLLTSETLGEMSDKSKYVAGIASKNANRLAKLIDDLLDFQKLKAGMMEYRMARIDLVRLVAEAAEINRPGAASREVCIEVLPAGNPLFVHGDADRLMQVVTNVLSNAIKFSDQGGLVTLGLEDRGTSALLFVSDAGIGIPENARDRVFAPFQQVDGSDRREFHGTGLGMSIAKQILDAHGGTIGYESAVGVGTTFLIELELEAPPTPEMQDRSVDAPAVNLALAAGRLDRVH